MTTTRPRNSQTLERASIALAVGFLAAVLVTYVSAVFMDITELVAKPYDPGSLLFGALLMSPVGIMAILTARPARVATAAAAILALSYAWIGQDILREVAWLIACIVAMAYMTAYVAWAGAHTVRQIYSPTPR